MVTSLHQFEKNVQASFGYVKKDLLMLNDALSDIHDKIQHLSLNHAALLEKMQRIESEVVKVERKEKKIEKKVRPVKSKKAKKVRKTKKPAKKVIKETVTTYS